MTGDVIPLAGRLGKLPPVAVARQPWDGCEHKATSIDTKLRTVACRECGATLDPIEVLVGLARQWDSWEYEYQQLMKARAGHEADERAKWERARDRHLNANPTHAIDPSRGSWGSSREGCRICRSLEVRAPSSVRALARSPA